MNTPIYDFMCRYSNSDILRFHMPGHKGSSPEPLLDMLYKLDITEIKGADSLFEADGIIAESEKNASRLFNTAGTFYSVGGSTLCIQTMLALMKREGRTVIAARNVHRAFLNAAALLDLDVHWLYLKYSGGILTGEIPLDELEKELMECKAPTCVYITSPDYTGKTADIEKISSICRKYNSPLLVDNAHGPHLAFFEKSRHPIARGADLCCDSAHKMLPALTGAAYLHISDLKYADKVKDAMTLFASTSPSYLIMASLDLCNRYIDEKIREDIKNIQQRVEKLRAKLSARLVFADSEPFHITINAAESGFGVKEFAEKKSVSIDELENYPCLTFEQGDKSSFYFAEEIFNTSDYTRVIKALDRSTMLNLMKGLNGYTFCSGIICGNLNGSDYKAIPISDKT